jgi:hypothetical protein
MPFASSSTCVANSRVVTSAHEPASRRRNPMVAPNRSAFAQTMSVRLSVSVTPGKLACLAGRRVRRP